jgi:putative flippase GtrA
MLNPWRSTFVKYVTVGLANTLCGLLIIYAMKFFAGASDVQSNVVGYAAGVVISFLLNRSWTFEFDGSNAYAFLRFAVVMMIAYALNLATVLAAIRLGINAYVAQAIGIVPYTVFGYLASKYIAFRAGRTQFR